LSVPGSRQRIQRQPWCASWRQLVRDHWQPGAE
jgi:hypothetical protein